MATSEGEQPVRPADAGPLAMRSCEGARWLIELRGELDLSNAHILNQELHVAGTSDAEEIVVDLSHLTFMDSSGLHVLLRAADREPERLRLIEASPNVQALFRVTGMEPRLPFVPAGT